ncbi:MAG: thiamine biosynthesis protein ThiF [Rickettsiales bacterium]|jgi:hypothetical protein|nr:thiamine biosynthesis protein ThiF [Rickettsiales bacterium]
MQYRLRISGKHHERLASHLFPGDGKEAVAVALCGHHTNGGSHYLLVHDIYCIPYHVCERSADYVNWKTESIIPILEKGAKKKLSFIKIHSHPTGYDQFSMIDDKSDKMLFPSVYGWIDGDQAHGSVVMLPGGKLFGRIVDKNASFHPIEKIAVVGDLIRIWDLKSVSVDAALSKRNIQAFGMGTTKLLKGMKIGVVGASGTGSPTIEQLARLGAGELVIIDPKLVEKRNLNRILNTNSRHVENHEFKVDVIADCIGSIGFGTKVYVFKENLYDSREAILALISCDIIFGCVDSIDGRHLLNQISTFYLIPLIDMGVKLEADDLGGIRQINGAVHYIQPGGSSLMTRGVYKMKGLEAAGLMRQDPEEYERRSHEKYIVNLPVESPAVISVNMQTSSYAINEFLDRIHPFKGTDPKDRAAIWLSISEDMIFTEQDGTPDSFLEKRVGRGDIKPFLEMPEL